MSIIKATEDGIEVDGILLKDVNDLKVYLNVHRPEGLSVKIGAIPPKPLTVSIHKWHMSDYAVELDLHEPTQMEVQVDIHEPASLGLDVGVHPPQGLNLKIGANRPNPLRVFFEPIHNSPGLNVAMDMHLPTSFEVGLDTHLPTSLAAVFGLHQPHSLLTKMGINRPSVLKILFEPIHLTTWTVSLDTHPPHYLSAMVDTHLPTSFEIQFLLHEPSAVQARIHALPPIPLYIVLKTWHVGHLYTLVASHEPIPIEVYVKLHSPVALSAYIDMHGPHPLNLYVDAVPPKRLEAYLQPWHVSPSFDVSFKLHEPVGLEAYFKLHSPHVLNTYIGANSPKPLPTYIGANQPAPLYFLLHYWHFLDSLSVQLQSHLPHSFETSMKLHPAATLWVVISSPVPVGLSVPIGVNRPQPLTWIIQPWHVFDRLNVTFRMHDPTSLAVSFLMHLPTSLQAVVKNHKPYTLTLPIKVHPAKTLTWPIQPWHVYDKLSVSMRLHDPTSYQVLVKMHLPTSYDVYVKTHVPDPLSIRIGMVPPSLLKILIEPFHVYGLSVEFGTVYPSSMQAQFALHLPYVMQAVFNLHRPQALSLFLGITKPARLSALLGVNKPFGLNIWLEPFTTFDMSVVLDTHLPHHLNVGLGMHAPHALQVALGGNRPYPLQLTMWVWTEAFFSAMVAGGLPSDYRVQFSMQSPTSLDVSFFGPEAPKLYVKTGIVRPYSLLIWLEPSHTAYLQAIFSVHAPHLLDVGFGLHVAAPLEAQIYGNRPYALSVIISHFLQGDSSFNVGFKLHIPHYLTVFLQAYKPEQNLFIYIVGNLPSVLNAYLAATGPKQLRAYLGIHFPKVLPVMIGGHKPADLVFLLHYWQFKDFVVSLSSAIPSEFKVKLWMHSPVGLNTYLKMHAPHAFTASLFPIPYHKLTILFQSWHTWDAPIAYIASHVPVVLSIISSVTYPTPLIAYINPMYTKSFKAWFFIEEFGDRSLLVWFNAVLTTTINFSVDMYIWGTKPMSVGLNIHTAKALQTDLWVWTPSDVTVLIATASPVPPLAVGLSAEAEPGVDFRVIHGFYKYGNLNVDFGIWTTFYNFYAVIWGVYKTHLEVTFRMGGSSRLFVPLPGTSGYKTLYVTCKPASRIMTTIIPVYTIEVKELYVSINQGWPCGFGSSYKNFSVSFQAAYFLAFGVEFKVIHGSGQPVVGVFVNRAYFDTYINKFDFHITIPQEFTAPTLYISDKVDIVYNNDFDDIVQDIMQVTFSWPRIRLCFGSFGFSVELSAYKGDKVHGLSVYLLAQRQEPRTQPPSKPLMPRENNLDPVWPDIFQVTEIELWGNDPPEIVRKVEIKFEEQIHEYYWISSEQRAVSKNVWEQWSFLTRGYLPSTEYSGQIDYLTMRSLSNMIRYDTIDQAVRAMISNFLYSDKTGFNVTLSPHGGYAPLLIEMTIRDLGRLRNLRVEIEPMHVQALSIDLNIT